MSDVASNHSQYLLRLHQTGSLVRLMRKVAYLRVTLSTVALLRRLVKGHVAKGGPQRAEVDIEVDPDVVDVSPRRRRVLVVVLVSLWRAGGVKWSAGWG